MLHLRFLLILVVLLSKPMLAFAQTPEQLKQFSSLPPQQQAMVARQLGIDINTLRRQASQTQEEPVNETPAYPRGTLFDELGNPKDPLAFPDEDEELEEELQLYGKELFANGPSTFSPQLNGDVPDRYILGTGDELNVQLFGKVNAEYLVPVGVDGEISLPDIGPVSVVGKTYRKVQEEITSAVKQSLLGVNVVVSLTKLKSIKVFISGEAFKPGAYNLHGLSTVTNALYAAGGVTDIASLRGVTVNRDGKIHTTMDVYDLLINGDSSNDITLRHGDVVHIPVAKNSVTVDGEVLRPAIYELKDEESLTDVLNLAGGAKPQGYTKYTGVKRVEQGVYVQLTVDVADSQFAVRHGDEITVPLVSERVSNAVTLIGAVARPGQYQWQVGLTVRKVIGDPNTSLLDDADISYILVIRQPSISSPLTFKQLDLSSDSDIDLVANDRVMVFSTIEAVELHQEQLDDLIATQDQISERRNEQLEDFVEQRLFMQRLGVYESSEQNIDEETLPPQEVNLSETEITAIRELRATHPFSRRNLLASVLEQIQEDAGFLNPPKEFEVGGSVRVPGRYPLPDNASVADAILAAGGLLAKAHASRSEITRIQIGQNGEPVIEHVEFSPQQELSQSASISLQSRDRLNIFTVPDWQEEIRVTLRGEVVFPGEYTVRRGETLSELISRAGGYTDYADTDALVFTRESLRVQERRNLEKLAEELRREIASESLRRDNSAGAIVSYDEARQLLRDLTQAEAVGRLVIDSQGGAEDDSLKVLLEDQDFVLVPKVSQSVNVIGEVYVPTSHLFSDSLSFEEYVKRSGGYRPLADSDRAYIIRANGSVVIPNTGSGFWFDSQTANVVIKPGDTIVVPYDSDNVETITLWTNATQILYQLAVAVAAIGSL